MPSTTSAGPNELPRSTPEAQGLSSGAIAGFLDAVAADAALELHSLMILRHGVVVAEGWWELYRREDVHLLYSLSKSFTSTAVGFAQAEGLLNLDRPAWEYLPSIERVEDERLRRLTVRQALRMATGHRTDTIEQVNRAGGSGEPLRGFFDTPPEEEPGTIFCYNNRGTYLVAALVQQVSGMTLADYLQPRLFDPLGIAPPYWQSAPPGRNIGFSGLHLATESIARFGQTYLDDGVWNGHQVLPPGWVEEATRFHTANPGESEPDWRQGYGYQFWRSRHDGYRGDGAFGQFCLILPELDTVIITTAATEQMQRVLDLVWHRLLPGFGEAELADDHGRADALAERLSAATLAPITTAGASAPTADLRQDLQQSRDPGEVDHGTPMLVEVEDRKDPAMTDDDHDGVLVVGLPDADDQHRYRVPFRSGGWVRADLAVGDRTLRVAGTGGWTSEDDFAAEVGFLNTPHRLVITGRRSGSGWTSESSWNCAPLGAADPGALAVG